MEKLKYFKNVTTNSADFYVYGDIVDDSTDWWTGEKDAFNVDPLDVKDELDQLQGQGIRELNIYINSGGGSVFASSTMVNLFRRFREQNGANINAYVDGLCASASTYLLMMADTVNIYDNSIVMIHKPMTWSFGNADDLKKDIETLDTIENDMMVPLYLAKATVSEDEIKDLIAKETWFNGNPDSELFIGNYFNVNYLEDSKQAVACSSLLLNKYTNTPKVLQNTKEPTKEPIAEPVKVIDNQKPEQPKKMADNSLYNYRIKVLNLKEV